MNKTTVVIPNYNGIDFIEKCLTSVEKSTVPLNITVVDNGSSDGSKELVKDKFPNVKLIELSENTGFCHAVNVGIENSDTPYVYLLNNDTVIEENAVEILENDMDTLPGAFSIQSKMVKMQDASVIDSAGDLYCALGWAYALGKDKPSSKYTGIHKVFSCCGGAALYRKKILNEIGCFDEKHFAYLEDVDLGYRANLHGYTNYTDSNSVICHAGSAASGSRYNEFKVAHSSRNSIYLIYKNMPIVQVIVNLPFFLFGYIVKWLFFIKKGLGHTYIEGIRQGLALCGTDYAKEHKVKFVFKRIGRYIIIEIKLIGNIFRRLS